MISFPLICSLIVGSVLALCFSGSSRNIGIICIVVLTFLFPIPMLIVVLFGVGTYFYRKVFSK
jgi:hypothetical protein